MCSSDLPGAVPGAFAEKVGRMVAADGGTLLLDEVGALPEETQAALDRVLATGEVRPVGCNGSTSVDVRLIATSSRPVLDKLHPGLASRLGSTTVTLPALRDRSSDIPALARHLLARHARQPGMRSLSIGNDALAILMRYGWPGNVRQLENTVFRAMVLCEGDRLEIQDFPQIASLVDGYEIKIPPAPPLPAKPPMPQGAAAVVGGHPMPRSGGQQVADGVAYGISVVTDGGHIRKLEEVEADMIRLALNRYQGQMSEVARKLGIGRSTLYRKMKDLGLEEAAG